MKRTLICALILTAALCFAPSPAAAADEEPAAEQAQQTETKDFLLVRGTISAIDAKAGKVTVRQEDKKEISATFSADSSTVWLGYEDVDFSDLKKGQLVDMECAGPEDKRAINWIEIYETQETAAQP